MSVPGPASYDVHDIRSCTPAFTLGMRPVIVSRSVSPGPCTYRFDDKSPFSPRWSFGSGKRWKGKNSTLPGPADYDTGVAAILPKSPAFSMKSRCKVICEDLSAMPGPGAYGDMFTQFE